MPNKARLIFTKTPFSPVSFLVRWMLPRSRFSLALSSHVVIEIDDVLYEAVMFKGVRKDSCNVILKNCKIVKIVEYDVPDLEAGKQFLESQLGKKYDLNGALGVGIDPDRKWDDDNKWYCYELAAGFLNACGLNLFKDLGHITETPLLAIA